MQPDFIRKRHLQYRYLKRFFTCNWFFLLDLLLILRFGDIFVIRNLFSLSFQNLSRLRKLNQNWTCNKTKNILQSANWILVFILMFMFQYHSLRFSSLSVNASLCFPRAVMLRLRAWREFLQFRLLPFISFRCNIVNISTTHVKKNNEKNRNSKPSVSPYRVR